MTRNLGRKTAGLSGYFTQQNVGKRAICADLTKPGATELLKALAAKADVVTENFRPGVMASFGLGWDDLVGGQPEARHDVDLRLRSTRPRTRPRLLRADHPRRDGPAPSSATRHRRRPTGRSRPVGGRHLDRPARHGRAAGRAARRAAHRSGPTRRHGHDQRVVLHRRLRPRRDRQHPHDRRRRHRVRGHRRADHAGRRREVVLAGAQHPGRPGRPDAGGCRPADQDQATTRGDRAVSAVLPRPGVADRQARTRSTWPGERCSTIGRCSTAKVPSRLARCSSRSTTATVGPAR